MKSQTSEARPKSLGHPNSCKCDLCKQALKIKNAKRNRQAHRLPLDPLIEYFGSSFKKRHQYTIDSWTKIGVSVFVVDRICCDAGKHPSEVYGDLWYEDVWRKDREETNDR